MYDAKLRRLARSAARLAHTRYPAFLLGGAVPPQEIPVFTYHDVEPDALRIDLDYLETNGYRTLGLDEFHAHMSEASAPPRSVLLTFDDARCSFWQNALPVLREREARAALFVPSYWMQGGSGAAVGPTPEFNAARRGFMTWEQLRECSRSGLVDVESHGHRHTLVATSDRVVAFATPHALSHYDLFDWPMRREPGGDVLGPPQLGTPVYESQPLLSATTRFLEARSAAEACTDIVAAAGGSTFFLRADAIGRLRAAHAAAIAHDGGLRPVSPVEFEQQVEAELGEAVRCFERELGRRPRYFAYPWMLGTGRSLELLVELGMEAAFGVALDYRRARREKGPLRAYGRFKSDWLRFLPGKGRRQLRHVLPRKVATFVASQHLAH